MLKRFVLATFCGLCLCGVAFSQRVASAGPQVSEKQRTDNDMRAAHERYGKARDSGNPAEIREAGRALRDAADAYDATRGGRNRPDIDFKDQPISRDFDRMKDWDRRMGGPDRSPQRDSPGRGPGRGRDNTADKSDRGGRSGPTDKGGGPDRSTGRDRSSDKADRSSDRSNGVERAGGFRDRN